MNLIRFSAVGGLALCLALSLPARAHVAEQDIQSLSMPEAVESPLVSKSPPLTYVAANQSKKKKNTQTNFQSRQSKKKTYCGYAQEPNQAGMSDYCSYMYNIYCRRGVGCNIYGR